MLFCLVFIGKHEAWSRANHNGGVYPRQPPEPSNTDTNVISSAWVIMGFDPKIPTQNPFCPFVSQEKVRIKNSRRWELDTQHTWKEARWDKVLRQNTVIKTGHADKHHFRTCLLSNPDPGTGKGPQGHLLPGSNLEPPLQQSFLSTANSNPA